MAALVGSSSLFLGQVEVADSAAVTRTCGSAFDSVVDRSGWEQWWARDLDEPDVFAQTTLLRTRRCPNAINQRLSLTAVLAGIGVLLVLVVRPRTSKRTARAEMESASSPETVAAARIKRVGNATSTVGAALTCAAVVGLIVLVADADSTLFLYVDRLVVAVLGVIVLTPTLSLVSTGRALAILGDQLEQRESAQPAADPADD